jgi:hypothetical protein
MAKVRNDIRKRGRMYSNGQVAKLIKGGPLHL